MPLRPSDVTKGGQITAYRVKMFNQVNNWFSFWIVSILLGASLLAFFMLTPPEIISNGLTYWIAWSSKSFVGLMVNDTAKTFSYAIYHGDQKVREVPLTLSDVLNSTIMREVGDTFLLRLEAFSGTACALAIVVYFVLMYGIARIGKKETEDKYLSGMTLTDNPKEVNKLLAKNNALSPLKIGPLHLVKHSEIQNILIQGTIGTGKSTIIRYLLDYIRKRGDRFIIFDPGSTFIKTHYDAERDFILDPHDARCANWDLWHECQTVVDYENFASSLIPIEGNSDPFWVSSSRTICADTAMKMSRVDNPTIEEFLHTILSLSLKSLREFLKNTPSANLVEEKIEKTAISIRSVTTNYVKSLRFLQGINQGQEKFSIREWIQDSRYQNSGLFISTMHLKSTRPLISMWIAMATSLLQSMGEDRNRRVWIIMDEVPSLQKIPGLREVLADGRKYGACFTLGAQNYAQMCDTYGRDYARAVMDLLNTRIYGRSPSYEQAMEVEHELGKQRKSKAREQNSFGLDQVRDGISIGRDETYEPVVDHTEIMRLPDLSFYFRLPGEYPVLKMAVPYRDLPKKAESHIERRFHDSLSPLIEKIIFHNETGTPADFVEPQKAENALESAEVISGTEAVVAGQDTVADSSVNQQEKAATVPARPENEVPDNVTQIFARARAKTRGAEQEAVNQPVSSVSTPVSVPDATQKPAPAPVASVSKPASIPEATQEPAPAPAPAPAASVTAPAKAAEGLKTTTGKRASSSLVLRLKKLGSESESDSDTPSPTLNAVMYKDEDKLIVKDESALNHDGSIVDAMAEEEKNILAHRHAATEEHEEPEL